MARITIDWNKCGGSKCGKCAETCPTQALMVGNETIIIMAPEICDFCKICVQVCPEHCISIKDDFV